MVLMIPELASGHPSLLHRRAESSESAVAFTRDQFQEHRLKRREPGAAGSTPGCHRIDRVPPHGAGFIAGLTVMHPAKGAEPEARFPCVTGTDPESAGTSHRVLEDQS